MSVNQPDREILKPLCDRWSPYRFDVRCVEDDKILTCLEAARWAASSFNDQPWSWIVARRQETDGFDRMLSCLMEANQAWAKHAGVLLLGVTRTTFRYNQKPNRVALHDLGAAAAHMALQATTLGLQIHQMAGVNLSIARQMYSIPEGHDPQTAITIGYPDTTEPNSDEARELEKRQSGPRTRLTLAEQTFSVKWGTPASFL